MAPQLIFGTSTFGMDQMQFQDAESVEKILQTLWDFDVRRLDSGARYPPLRPGRSETLIGEAKRLSKDFEVDTKVYTNTATDGSGDLTVEAIRTSVHGSLQRLQRPEGVNVLYIHRADPTTPLKEQIRGFSEQIAQGRCKSWGVSNVPVAMLEEILRLCEQNGWHKPSCYQGLLNLVSRGMETKLLPLLRAHGMKFNGYQPLAAGILTCKLIHGQHAGTRMAEDDPFSSLLRRMYGVENLLDPLRKFSAAVTSQGLTPTEVALRWVVHHSPLGDEDGLIFGASRMEQVIETVGIMRKGPLPDAVLLSIEELWASVRESRGDAL